MSQEKQSEWISMEEKLPNEGEEVLIYAGEIGVAKLVRGISEEERRKMKNEEMPDPTEHVWSLSTGWREIKRSDIYRAEDEGFNNLKPFRFVGNGNAQWCGQNVTHWMPLPEPPQMKGGGTTWRIGRYN